MLFYLKKIKYFLICLCVLLSSCDDVKTNQINTCEIGKPHGICMAFLSPDEDASWQYIEISKIGIPMKPNLDGWRFVFFNENGTPITGKMEVERKTDGSFYQLKFDLPSYIGIPVLTPDNTINLMVLIDNKTALNFNKTKEPFPNDEKPKNAKEFLGIVRNTKLNSSID